MNNQGRRDQDDDDFELEDLGNLDRDDYGADPLE